MNSKNRSMRQPFSLQKIHWKFDGSLFHNETPQRLVVLLFLCMPTRRTHRWPHTVIIVSAWLFLVAFSLDYPRVGTLLTGNVLRGFLVDWQAPFMRFCLFALERYLLFQGWLGLGDELGRRMWGCVDSVGYVQGLWNEDQLLVVDLLPAWPWGIVWGHFVHVLV